MDNKNKILSHIEKYAVTYLFIALSILFIIVSGLDFNYVASQLLMRLNRNSYKPFRKPLIAFASGVKARIFYNLTVDFFIRETDRF